MRIAFLSLALASLTLPLAAVDAQPRHAHAHGHDKVAKQQRKVIKERRKLVRARADARSERQAFRAERHYRSRGYRPLPVTRNTRVYRGYDDRYYCRRSDGTTGLIIGGVLGAVAGNQLAPGGSRLIGTLIGGGGGALLGRAIEGRRLVCR